MNVLSDSPEDRAAIAAAAASGRLVVVTLCAAWCNTCTEFRAALATVAAERPAVAFVWLDIEDDAAICGEVDVESFPMLFAFRGDAILHFGTSVPLRNVVGRVVDDLATRRQTLADVPTALLDLHRALLWLTEAA